jgi:hypothetical protein
LAFECGEPEDGEGAVGECYGVAGAKGVGGHGPKVIWRRELEEAEPKGVGLVAVSRLALEVSVPRARGAFGALRGRGGRCRVGRPW